MSNRFLVILLIVAMRIYATKDTDFTFFFEATLVTNLARMWGR